MPIQKNKIIISLNPKVYPLEAIYGAAYKFLDKAYIFLDGDPNSKIQVTLKLKEGSSQEKLKKLKDEFLNELLNQNLRNIISRQNQKIREYIVLQALLGSYGVPATELRTEEKAEEPDWKKDPLGIAIPWEEKYGKKKKKHLP